MFSYQKVLSGANEALWRQYVGDAETRTHKIISYQIAQRVYRRFHFEKPKKDHNFIFKSKQLYNLYAAIKNIPHYTLSPSL